MHIKKCKISSQSNHILHPSPNRKFKFIQSLFNRSHFFLLSVYASLQARLCKLIPHFLALICKAIECLSLFTCIICLCTYAADKKMGKIYFSPYEIIKWVVKIEICDLDFIYAILITLCLRCGLDCFSHSLSALSSIKIHLSTFRNYCRFSVINSLHLF